MLQLTYLDIGELVQAAGGDPWKLNDTIQSGSPGEIHDLATAFYDAGVCLGDTSEEFNAAKKRFEAAWDREDAGHPINDSREVTHATQTLDLNKEQLARVAVDLQNISASLAEAQRSGSISISNLEASLQFIDNQIHNEVVTAAANGEEADWSDLKQAAIDRTAQALKEVQAVRDSYSQQLDQSRLEMAAEGYTPDATKGSEGDGGLTPGDQARADAEKYAASQRAADEALVNSPGPWTPAKSEAAGRLRDYATINDPNADPNAARFAGERLNDYFTAQFQGPLPVDPVLGRDARQRAQERLYLQQKMEAGLGAMPPMAPDAATELLNISEGKARQLAINQAIESLTRAGMSPDGAKSVVGDLARGVPWNQLLEQNGQLLSAGSGGLQAVEKTLPHGSHYKPHELTLRDAGILGDVGKRLGWAGTAIDVFDLGYDLSQGAAPGQRIGEFAGGAGGGALGAVGAAAIAGSVLGPGGTFVAAVAASVALSEGGKRVGGWVGSQFDN
ncbi:hypothetical protein [Mycobacterium hubeiense]|uniref:putative alpha/beta hydrolase n=1 Tax=Mycobacterium hubeiense TaxID=1867256 RepID=UPI000C7E9D5F|nr:hypothetical protein [Mycobacterium sp. QGD 101]